MTPMSQEAIIAVLALTLLVLGAISVYVLMRPKPFFGSYENDSLTSSTTPSFPYSKQTADFNELRLRSKSSAHTE
jgi:hypothetical protein